MASGIPVVAADIPGARELFRINKTAGWSGRKFDFLSQHAYRGDLITPVAQTDGRKSPANCRSLSDRENCYTTYADLYRELVRETLPSRSDLTNFGDLPFWDIDYRGLFPRLGIPALLLDLRPITRTYFPGAYHSAGIIHSCPIQSVGD
jgi:hypothetical protein